MRYDRRLLTPLACALVMGAVAGSVCRAEPGSPSAEGVEFFETKIRPVLAERCYECHSAKAKILQGGLRLDSAQRLLAGGDSGPVIVPGKPEESSLLSALRYESFEMPPSGKLPDNVIADFAKWISLGAPDPRVDTAIAGNENPAADMRSHWAYQRPQRPAPPDGKHTSQARSDIDRFILARLEAAGLSPSQQASPRTVLRRLYYDLIGLPPSAKELADFEADPSDARYEATVDWLLTSPHYGERWARYWLDLARYADTKGYLFEEDRNYKHAYKYRDWVIASFTADRPYDEFIVAQLAADQVDDPDSAPASGFLTLGRRFLNNKHDIIDDRIDVVTRGLLGLTVACARCHDHKYDPISAGDYYAMYGVFASSREKPRDDAPPMLVDVEEPVDPVIFLRGSPGSRGPKVQRRFLTCLAPNNKPQPFRHGSGRREMAEAIASRDNPLTARVWVNRVWAHLFGAGLVTTLSDFGSRGTPPTHPQLLDWLACELMDEGWSTKHLIRRIVLSGTYRQASEERADCAAVDPENRLLWRASRRRLDLESLRDSVLQAAGRLDDAIGGPSVPLTGTPFPTRRSVYGFIERQNLPAFFRTFDFANPNTHTPQRPQTVAPQQALFLMNSPFVMEQAIHLAARSEHERNGVAVAAPSSANIRPPLDEPAKAARIVRLFQHALGREPTSEETAQALAFVSAGEPAASAQIAAHIPWQLGWGTYDEAGGAVQFQPLAAFTGTAWQGGANLPDPATGWAMLTANGGHPGDAAHQAIRRWVAPAAGQLHIEGILAHGADQGDGVRGRVVASRGGLIGSWEVFHGERATAPSPLAVETGDTIDFITDCRNSIEHDSFSWSVTLRLASSERESGQVWDSVGGFHGPIVLPLSRWEQLAQILLMSNEFAFVD